MKGTGQIRKQHTLSLSSAQFEQLHTHTEKPALPVTTMKSSPVTTAAHPSYMSDLTEVTTLHQIDKTHTLQRK